MTTETARNELLDRVDEVLTAAGFVKAYVIAFEHGSGISCAGSGIGQCDLIKELQDMFSVRKTKHELM